MKSLKELYKTGLGPSSSHTMGPAAAAFRFAASYPEAALYCTVLYGSLASTGKGHGTDRALKKVFGDKCGEIIFDTVTPPAHPNTLEFFAFDKDGAEIGKLQAFSVGGGDVVVAGETPSLKDEVYDLTSFTEIKKYCAQNNIELWQYAAESEGDGIFPFIENVWKTMQRSVEKGLSAEGILEGGLGVQRRAKLLLIPRDDENAQTRENRLISAYAFAVSEENAAGGTVVTAPTCGSSGVVPSVMYYYKTQYERHDDEIVKALLTAGLVGNLVKSNASVSGAECGCQAEIGTACAMAAAGLAYLNKMSSDEIEYSAEVALEHHLGLTCDPVGGLVQIPCIERNAVAAMRAVNAVSLASFLTDSAKVSLDTVIRTMNETGRDLNARYRETANGGLAKYVR